MTARTFDYFGARICIEEEYKDGSKDAKIFPNRGIEFISGRYSKEDFRKKLEDIREGKLELNVEELK